MNTLADLLSTLVFLGSLLIVAALLLAGLIIALGRHWAHLSRVARILGAFIALYAVVLLTVSLATPRRVLDPGQSECFDDWCVAGVSAKLAPSSLCPGESNGTVWVATLQVSSRARGITQPASDAAAVLEDRANRQFKPCAGPLPTPGQGAHALTDYLRPGESFTARLPFRLPASAQPAGLVLSHGAFPGVLIIAADQSGFHKHTLFKVALYNK